MHAALHLLRPSGAGVVPGRCGTAPATACCGKAPHPGTHATTAPQLTCSRRVLLQDDWLKRAELAVSKGEDELAREALKRRKAYQVGPGAQPDVGARQVQRLLHLGRQLQELLVTPRCYSLQQPACSSLPHVAKSECTGACELLFPMSHH
jgi:hypothetical protein